MLDYPTIPHPVHRPFLLLAHVTLSLAIHVDALSLRCLSLALAKPVAV
jgi:hypothetical protein